jgi:hypothetical protein
MTRPPLFRGTIDLALLLPVMIGLIYAGTGGWTAERWNGALAIMGLGGIHRAYRSGYETYNPDLHGPDEPPRRG